MKAAQINEYGDSSVIQINEVDKPELNDGQVLVEVYASSLNPFDTTVRTGQAQTTMPLQFPTTLGGDISGVVTEVSEGVSDVAVGDKIYGQASVFGGNSGALAEFAATKAAQVAKAPSNLDFQQSASLPLVGVSALQALTEHLNLQAGQKVFIHGGAGGIGSIAIQIAKHLGAHVAATAGPEQLELVKTLGADEVINYKAQDFSEVLHDYDAVFDTVGRDDFTKSLVILKKGGNAVSMAAQADEAKVRELEVNAQTQSTHITAEKLNDLRELIEAGVVTPTIGKVFKLDEIQEAYTARESGSVAGKIVIEIKSL